MRLIYPPLSFRRRTEDIHVPLRDIDMSLLERSQYITYCPYNGEENDYSITVLGESGLTSTWTCETPFVAVGNTSGCLAFYPTGCRSSLLTKPQPTTHAIYRSIPIQNRWYSVSVNIILRRNMRIFVRPPGHGPPTERNSYDDQDLRRSRLGQLASRDHRREDHGH
ncbi:DUF427 domain-containing protein [Pollutimonas bauzanensis]|uniref:DUF427 domain-containing protein n=1 Tax=Pollutimonas bauzanensis TaxID=658167 RepID=UPI003CCC17DE